MIKILNPSVVKIVGSIASVLLRHLKYWKDSSGKEVVYRTNTQLVEDLEGMFSASQIQRAKKKLIDSGLIHITYGKGYDRTTHYSLTQKALDLLNAPKNDSKNDTDTKGDSGTTIPPKSKTKPYHAKTMPKSNVSSGTSETMKQSFDEQGKPRSNVVKGIPDTLKHLLKGKKEEVVEKSTVVEEHEDVISQNEYDECELAMLHALRNHSNNDSPVEHNDESLTLGSLVGTVFKQAASEDRKKIYQMGQIQYRFSEDY